MTEERKRAPAGAMRAIEEEARVDAGEEVLDALDAMSPEQVAAELLAAGVEPDEAARRVRASLEAALAADRGAAAPAVGPAARVAPVVDLASRRRGPWGIVGGVTAAAAAVLLLVVGAKQLGGDRGPASPAPPEVTVKPEARQRSLELRRVALRACDAGDLAECKQGLDEAARADPASERDPRVIEARKKIAAQGGTRAP